MSKNNESSLERLERMKREREAAKAAAKDGAELVDQLTHESDGEPDFEKLATKLKERHEAEKTSVLAGTVKYTIYLDEDVAAAFNALCLKRGDQRRYINQAIKDFVIKKAKELNI